MKDIFIYGMSGSGKDTISNYLRDNYNYLKLRIAGTIKQYIYEIYGFIDQEQFEIQKRNNSEVRKMHNTFGNMYDTDGIKYSGIEGEFNRLRNLINRKSFEFEITQDLEHYPLCISDVRTFKEAKYLLMNGINGIFLNRRNLDEYHDDTNKTEKDMFLNGELNTLVKNYNNITIILNDNINLDGIKDQMIYEFYSLNKDISVLKTDGSQIDLINKIHQVL